MATLDPDVTALCPNLDADAVREIIETELTDAQINFFINLAYYVTIPLTGNLGSCGGNDMHCSIITVLAAHYITMRERQVKSESVAGEWSVTFLGKDDLGLDSSLYGQNAKQLDCSGYLSRLGLKAATMAAITYYDMAGSSFEPSDVIN